MSLAAPRLPSVKRRRLTQTSYNAGRLLRAWPRRWRGERPGCRERLGCTTDEETPTDTHRINAPTIARSTVIAGHPPPEFSAGSYLKCRYVHDSRHETARVSAPCLPTSNGTASISGDRAIVAAHHETAASGKDVLKCVAPSVLSSNTPPSKPTLGSMSDASRLKLCRNDTCAQQLSKNEKDGESSRLSLKSAGSSMNAALGGVSAGGVGGPLSDVGPTTAAVLTRSSLATVVAMRAV